MKIEEETKLILILPNGEQAFMHAFEAEHWKKMWIDAHVDRNKTHEVHADAILTDRGAICIKLTLRRKGNGRS